MSGMLVMRARKLRMCQIGSRFEALDGDQQALE